MGDVPCKVSAGVVGISSKFLVLSLSSAVLLTSDVLCCHLNPREAERGGILVSLVVQ